MQQSLTPLVYALAFIAMVLAVQGMASILFSRRDRADRTNRRLAMLSSGMKSSEVYASLVRYPIGGAERNIVILRWFDRFALYCQQSGLAMPPTRVLAYLGAASAALWLFSMLFARDAGFVSLLMNGMVALPASGVICGFSLWIWLSRKRDQRLKKIEEQMPLALDVINRAIRAGHPVVAAVRLAGNEMGDPIGTEFGLVVDETTYGFEFREALTNFARRTGSPDAHFFAVSVGVQAETGGNLTEILEGLATVIRNRAMLRKRVRALSSEGRASALLLSGLPVFVIGFLMLIQPGYYTSKFSDPIFRPTVFVVLLLYFTGLIVIRRITNLKY